MDNLVTDRTQIYLTDPITQKELDKSLVKEIFHDNPTNYVFRHTDCPYVFITDGQLLYAQDMDEIGVDPVAQYGIYNIVHVYNNFKEFISTFTRIEEILGRELYLADRGSGLLKISIRGLYLYAVVEGFIAEKASNALL